MPQFNNFDPGRYALIVSGLQIQGFADGTVIKLKRATPTFSDKAGIGGDVVRSKSRDARGDLEITLLASSPSNDFLATLAVTDEQADAGVGAVGPMLLKDLNGTTTAGGASTWVTQPADIELAGEAPNRTWKLRIANLRMFPGGLTV